jgi:hypothetical protein
MSTSPSTGLTKPEGDKKVSAGTLAYVGARAQLRAYSLVIKELKESGITQAELAKRLGKAPEVISRMLSRPSNWEMKTFSQLLFAISGAVPTFAISRSLQKTDSDTTRFYKIPPGSAEAKVLDPKPETPHMTQSNISVPANVQINRDGIQLSNPRRAAAA